MGMEQRAPSGWFVRTQVDHDGSITFTVMKALGPGRDLTDKSFKVQHQVPWWVRLLYGNFEERLADAMEQSQKRAWTLNEQFKRSRQLAYDMDKRTRKENPHDD